MSPQERFLRDILRRRGITTDQPPRQANGPIAMRSDERFEVPRASDVHASHRSIERAQPNRHSTAPERLKPASCPAGSHSVAREARRASRPLLPAQLLPLLGAEQMPDLDDRLEFPLFRLGLQRAD